MPLPLHGMIEASPSIKEIMDEDNRFDVHIGELNGDFLPFDPAKNTPEAGTVEYLDEELSKLMKGHDESQVKAKLFHELRKTEKMIDNINENIDAQNKNKTDVTKKLSKAKTFDEIKTLTHSLEQIDVQINKMETRLKECVSEEARLKKETFGMDRPSDM